MSAFGHSSGPCWRGASGPGARAGRTRVVAVVAAVLLAFAAGGSAQVWWSTGGAAAALDRAACPLTPYVEYGLDDDFTSTWFGGEDLRAGLYLDSLGVWYAAPEFAKVHWLRPAGAPLTVEGRRLDGPSPPLDVRIPDGYETQGFQVTALTFPTAGCWEVVGRIPNAELRFIVEVHPADQYRSATPVSEDVWSTLERPVTAPAVDSGGACPRNPVGRVERVAGPAIGDGPVSIQGLGADATVAIADQGNPGEPVAVPIRLVADPGSAGPLLIRGVRLDRPGTVRFGSDGSESAMRMWGKGESTPPDWRVWRESVWLDDPGCYALQIDGVAFSEVVVFAVVVGPAERT